jgi:hypothetical protein
VAERETVPLKPFLLVTLTLVELLNPAVTVIEGELALRPKSDGEVTVAVSIAELLRILFLITAVPVTMRL